MIQVKHVGFIYREVFPKEGSDADWINREVFVMDLDEEQPVKSEESNEDKA